MVGTFLHPINAGRCDIHFNSLGCRCRGIADGGIAGETTPALEKPWGTTRR